MVVPEQVEGLVGRRLVVLRILLFVILCVVCTGIEVVAVGGEVAA